MVFHLVMLRSQTLDTDLQSSVLANQPQAET